MTVSHSRTLQCRAICRTENEKCRWFAGNFLVTIERLSVRHHSSLAEDVDSARVYTNLQHNIADHPISATVAGQIRSMRLVDTDGCDRLNVIEIPLKASPKSIAVNSAMCHLAIGLQTRVLVYGLSRKKAGGCFR